MLDDLSKKIDIQNIELKNLTQSFEAISFIIQNTEDSKTLNELKNILQDLKIVLENLGVNISELEVSLSTVTDSADISNTNKEITDNNTLLISEIQNKVVLPYTLKDLQKILDNNQKYKTLQDVIDDVYTFPLDKYKNSSASRFKEAYNLMRKKEKSSVFDSLSLATELTFNSLLNPAIISACKNLDELDVYLDCLSSNELDKFDLFKIKYEILPRKTFKH